MKTKILTLAFLTAIIFILPSCKKTWVCTCSGTVVGSSSGLVVDTNYNIPKTFKGTAQADCTADCAAILNSSSYTNVSATIKQQ